MLGELVDRMQDAIAAASPWTRWVDIAGLRFDEALVTFSLRRARADAWDFATELSRLPPAERLAREEQRDRDVTRLGQLIVRPGVPVRWMVNLARRRERHDLEGVLRSIGG